MAATRPGLIPHLSLFRTGTAPSSCRTIFQMPTVKVALCLVLSATLIAFCGCGLYPDLSAEKQLCDMTPDGSVWLTVVRFVWAEQKFHAERDRYGSLVEMTNLLDGLHAEVTSGRMGSYTITINLTQSGFVLRANPDRSQDKRRLAAFYGDQTELITFDRSGKPAGPESEKMSGTRTHFSAEQWKSVH